MEPVLARDDGGTGDEELFVRYRDAGDGQAFSALYDRLGPRFFRIGVRFFRSRHGNESARALAADAAQETWVAIVAGKAQWDSSRGGFASWAHTIHFRCLVHLSRRTPPPDRAAFDEQAMEVPSPNADPDRLLAAGRAIERLSAVVSGDDAALLGVYCLVGTPRHAAASLGISEPALRKRIERVRERVRRDPELRQLLESLGIGASGPLEPDR